MSDPVAQITITDQSGQRMVGLEQAVNFQALKEKAQKHFAEMIEKKKKIKIYKDTLNEAYEQDDKYSNAQAEVQQANEKKREAVKILELRHDETIMKIVELQTELKEDKEILKDLTFPILAKQEQLSLFDDSKNEWILKGAVEFAKKTKRRVFIF